MRVPLHRLIIGPDHVPGIDRAHLDRLLSGALVDERPLDVTPLPGGLFEIANGRHRYLAAVIRGDVDAEVAPI